MRGIFSRSAYIATILGLFGTAPPVSASYSPISRALTDGIGYRSNAIDPMNPYSVSRQHMFQVLLTRYKLLPDDIYFPHYHVAGSKTREEYVGVIRSLVSEKFTEFDFLKTPTYHYNFGNCHTNSFSAALSYVTAAVQELGKRVETDELIVARHRLLTICSLDAAQRVVQTGRILKRLRASLSAGLMAPWVRYLESIILFYDEKFDAAEKNFAALADSTDGWLQDTAGYMSVRIAKAKIDSRRFDLPPSTGKPAIDALGVAMAAYLKDHPEGLYADTVRSLNRFKIWARGDRDGLVAKSHGDFIRTINTKGALDDRRRLRLFFEISNSTKVIFDLPRGKYAGSPMHPLAVVNALLAEMIGERKGSEKVPEDEWRRRFVDASAFPGLGAYFDLLLLARNRAFDKIARLEISPKIFGPLHVDAMILRARALTKTGRQQEAATSWLRTSARYPLYNALTEAATAYVRMNRFPEFARLPKSWMTDLTYNRKITKHDYPYDDYDEFHIPVRNFYAKYQPYRNLLRSGFRSAKNPRENEDVYSDTALHPIIRFLAAEPLLNDSLLRANYAKFLQIAGTVFDTAFDSGWVEADGGREKKLIDAYRRLIPKVRALRLNHNDPHVLTGIGYFLYSQYRSPGCFQDDRTLWEEKRKTCPDVRAEDYPAGYQRPMDLFSRALRIYKGLPMRTAGEARLLRILIYCFRGSANRDSCLRGSEARYSKSIRRGYFQRLHKFFPQSAKRTPYWY